MKIHHEDSLPHKICGDCLSKVDIACEIKEKCLETDQLLRMQLKDEPKVEPVIEIKVVDDHPEWFVSLGYEATNRVIEESPELGGTASVKPKNEFNSSEEDFPIVKKKSRSSDSEVLIELPKKGPGSQMDRRKPRAEDFTCVFCHKDFKKIIEKTRHMRADHTDELVCPVCNRKRNSVIGTERCIKAHQFGLSFLCQICARSFRMKHQLNSHFAEAHSETREMFSCDVCGVSIRHKNSLLRHIRTGEFNSILVE